MLQILQIRKIDPENMKYDEQQLTCYVKKFGMKGK